MCVYLLEKKYKSGICPFSKKFGGWEGGWVGVKAVFSIAYSNKNVAYVPSKRDS